MSCDAATYTLAPLTSRIGLAFNAGDPIDIVVPILDADCNPVTILPGEQGWWAARGTVRRNVLAAEVLHEWSTSGARNAVILPGTPALVRLLASGEETASWQCWDDYTVGWDLDVTEPAIYGGWTTRIAQGPFTVLPEYTR